MIRLALLLCAFGLTTLAIGCPHPPAAVGEGEGEGAVAGEGEGAAAGEGEGAVAGEGEGAVAGEGEGEGATAGEGEGEGAAAGEGEGEGAVQTCTQNSDCPLGEICPSGSCVPGCQSVRDCAGGLECDTAAGPNGSCVECTTATEATDCRNGETCVNDRCAVQCTDSTACANTNGTPVCDTTAGVCVPCLQNGDCSLGNICINEQCVAGCQQARDCPTTAGGANEVCDTSVGNGECVPPCASNADCDPGTHCDTTAGFCKLGCNGDNTACPQGDVCQNNACVISCNSATNNTCANGDHCDVTAGVCAAGCAADTDCGFREPVCDTTSGQCVQCSAAEANACPNTAPVCETASDTCVQCDANDSTLCTQLSQNQFGAVFTCDLTVDQCRSSCDPTQNNGACFGNGGLQQGVCESTSTTDPTQGTCVECLANSDCNNGDTCDTTTHTCVAPPQTGGICTDCTSDADCGGTNQCVREDGGDVCAQDCSTTGTCPQGFACEFVTDASAQAGVITGKQCVPSDSAVQNPTCAAFLDTVAETQCQVGLGVLCGDNQRQNDGECLPASDNSQTGVCTERCNATADCPAGFACDAINLGNIQGNACVKQ